MTGRARAGGAVAGALVAGLGITALMIAGERRTGRPSELIALERTGARRLGLAAPGFGLPDAAEQAVTQGAHLALSAAAGIAFAALTDDDTGIVAAGTGFGLAFYTAMHWIAGPLLGLKPPEWRTDGRTMAMHAANHVAFGLATATGARIAQRATRNAPNEGPAHDA